MNILVINCGSSSLKYALRDMSSGSILVDGKSERLGESPDGRIRTHEEAIVHMLSSLSQFTVDAVGYRVVHGGSRFSAATVIDQAVIDEIRKRVPDAPMHNPYALVAIEKTMQQLKDVSHIAVFDTGFHMSMPRRAKTYAIESDVAKRHGIQRFGFHGISHTYVAKRAAHFLQRPLADLRLVTLHLGNGASACAVEFGRSAETSMGSTPLEGLVMGTRSGDVDAGVVLGLLRSGEFDLDSLDELLNNRSGLAGLSGVGNDLREIESAAEQGDDQARLAINVFAHRARKYIGAYAAAMGGVDAIVFTGGIGENSATMRGRILQRLEFLGLFLDDDKNSDAAVTADDDYARITTPRSRVESIVVKTNEELEIAQQCFDLLGAESPNNLSASSESVTGAIPIAVSGRHMHLTEETFSALFGQGRTPTHLKDLSQPGQFACEETVNLIGPRNRIDRVRLLGPLRKVDQIEISRTDEFRLGVDAPVRDSGQVRDSAPITLEGPAGKVHLKEGLICARRHIHMHTDDAAKFQVEDRQEVAVAIVGGPRDLVFGDVLVRVSDKYKLEMHIDTDEANAAELSRDFHGDLVYEDVDGAHASLE